MTKVFLLPGLGADHRMYEAPPWHTLKDATFLDWPDYTGETSISALADKVIQTAKIDDGAVIIGSSLGGIVACEIAHQIKLRSLVLVGSATHREEISGILDILHPLARFAPMEFMQAAAARIPRDLAQMFSHSQATFIRAMCQAVFTWPGLNSARITPLRIHGRHDHVIPMPPKVDLALDAGHLIAMTHAQECVDFLQVRKVA